jgi:hypothetical protein
LKVCLMGDFTRRRGFTLSDSNFLWMIVTDFPSVTDTHTHARRAFCWSDAFSEQLLSGLCNNPSYVVYFCICAHPCSLGRAY